MANAVRRILLQRIANYFLEWDGEDKTAPKLSLSIDELRAITSMHTELCRLEEEKRRTSKANESVKGDLISRTEVLKLVEDIKCDDSVPKNYGTLLDIMRQIRKLPTAHNDGWIPVSSGKLPKESGEYYTYVYYDGHYMYSIDEIDCDGMVKEWNCSSDYKIIAWKPIAPYQPKGEKS